MNFFEHQDKAQRRTTHLITLFIVAVGLVVFFTAFVVASTFGYITSPTDNTQPLTGIDFWRSVFKSPVFMWSAFITLAVIILGSFYKNLQLGGNGIAVALSLDGKHVHPETDNSNYKKLLNIVIEMALASGNPVPKVFVLPGHAINAFAAGYSRHQTVVAVTEGTLEQLNRDELQGVIAHEFSHINFGDVKINMRLVALLHGILLIGEIGRLIAYSNTRSYRSSNKSDNKAANIGYLIMVIGYVGTVFGNLIKAAVSRQREFLADASAVQFTRNPEGIAGALTKIGKGHQTNTIESSNANLYNHFYFSSLKPHFFSQWFATHPPIDERIKRLGYRFAGPSSTPKTQHVSSNHDANGNTMTTDHAMGFAAATVGARDIQSTAIIDSIGQPTAQHLHNAQQHIRDLPENLKHAADSAFSARALIYGLIITHTDARFHLSQMEYLDTHTDADTVATLKKIMPDIAILNAAAAFNLVLMADPALQDQSSQQAMQFKSCAKQLINSDAKFTLFEWCIYRLAITPLNNINSFKSGTKRLKECEQSIGVLLYYALSHTAAEQRMALLAKAQAIVGTEVTTPEVVSIKQLDVAITQLRELKPLCKPTLLKALIECIQGDGQITDDELTLIRMTALLLDCPIPDIALHLMP